MSLEWSFSIEWFPSYTASKIQKFQYNCVVFLCMLKLYLKTIHIINWKYRSEECSLCLSMFLKWYSSTLDALKNKSGLPFNTGRLGVRLYEIIHAVDNGVLRRLVPWSTEDKHASSDGWRIQAWYLTSYSSWTSRQKPQPDQEEGLT